MGTSTSNEIISLPKGGGAVQGIGEKFSPDLFTGTGNFSVPIALPPGRNGFQPALNLVYSTGNGNGPFGVGWALSIPGIARKTSEGIPRYQGEDTFILSGAEDLVPVEHGDGWDRYQPRTEGLFARIIRHRDTDNDYWTVESKDGLKSQYGTEKAAREDPAAIADPEKRSKVFAWRLTQTTDPFGNRIEYEYERDTNEPGAKRHWDQLYLKRIRYADFGDSADHNFLVTVTFHYQAPPPDHASPDPFSEYRYQDRPDKLSEYRSGFEIRTEKRCSRIEIHTHADKERLVRVYNLIYLDEQPKKQHELPLNGASLLTRIIVTGHDQEHPDPGQRKESLPPLDFRYTQFTPKAKERDFFPLDGHLPAASLQDPNLDLVDLFGNGLPDIVEMNGVTRYWRNLGNGRFDWPREIRNAPAGLAIANAGVQLLDANGNGRADLLVTQPGLSGYFPLQFDGSWDRRSFQSYDHAPSFDLKDPEVRLVDLTGDGITDAIRSGNRLECFFNDPKEGWNDTNFVERRSLDDFRNINFSDPRVKWADMSGDGLQDIVLVHDGNVEYWPNLGYGNWGRRVSMRNSPRFPAGYNPEHILLGDVDGDGHADMVYVDHCKVLLWINQSGNGWSDPIEIKGTPGFTGFDNVRLVDLLGTGVPGLLWSSDASRRIPHQAFFLDFTGGLKPYLLDEMNSHMGAVTRVAYEASTRFYLEDEHDKKTRWQTPLPFPVQVLTRVEVIDELSGGKLTTEYSYHHGYWDGDEREFRGFGRVDQRDTEEFERYDTNGLHPDNTFEQVEADRFSPPMETRTWFHQGPVKEESGEWITSDFTGEYWSGDENLLDDFSDLEQVLRRNTGQDRRDALRTLRGRVLRSELYARDGTERADRPYTVNENVYSVKEIEAPQPDADGQRIFFPHGLAARTSQWERGDDPMTTLTFTGDYDAFGQPRQSTQVACPKRWRNPGTTQTRDYLATHTTTTYAQRIDDTHYMVDRVANVRSYEIKLDHASTVQTLIRTVNGGTSTLNLIGQTLNYYDGEAYTGLPNGKLGGHGALVRSESLVLTEAILHEAYKSGDSVLALPEKPPYLDPERSSAWSDEYPQAFQDSVSELAGYVFYPEDDTHRGGYYVNSARNRYDFHDPQATEKRGMLTSTLDALGNATTVTYDQPYNSLPEAVTNAVGLTTRARYDYRLLQPQEVTNPNGNRTAYTYNPTGFLISVTVMGKSSDSAGDTLAEPSLKYEYDFLAYVNSGQPVSVHTIKREHHINDTDIPLPRRNDTIESVEYSDGFGRLLQARAQAEDLTIGDFSFGDAGLGPDQSKPVGDAVGKLRDPAAPRVIVTGWQVYDNKGRVVEKYEPFFSEGWDYSPPSDVQRGQKFTNYYDPRGKQIRTVSPNGSEQLIVQGVPLKLNDPFTYEPTPWEAYSYDLNDNAGRTHAAESKAYQTHWNTPSSVKVDALGRIIETVQRNGANSAEQWYRTVSTYDIRGNLLTVTDPFSRLASEHVYDLLDYVLSINNLDAGVRRRIQDAAGNLIEQRDSKGALILSGYDNLNRPFLKWARDKRGESVTLRERLIYGDSADSGLATAQALGDNLLGNLFRYYDEAGLLEISGYDFKGNILEKSRKTIRDDVVLNVFTPAPVNWYINTFRVEWQHPSNSDLDTHAATLLDTTAFQTSLQYDALNRVESIRYPIDVDGERKELLPDYNRAGALKSVIMDRENYVQHISYNAKGQRILIAYGNGIMTRHAYDPLTFRMLRMRTEHYTQPDTLTYHPKGQALQDMSYEYDLHGNMLSLHDRVPGSGIATQPDQLDREFTYDPIYRLLTATGRECDLPSSTQPWQDAPRCTDMSKSHSYTERYHYDAVGNMERVQHQISGGGFNRYFTLVAGTNQFDTLQIAPNIYQYQYDTNGNLIQENASRFFEWDYSDRLRSFQTQAGFSEPSIYSHYLYDATGRRVKKITRRSKNNVKSTIYIEDVFEFHHERSGTTIRNYNLLHIMDNEKRITIRRIGIPFPRDPSPKIQYHLGDHLGSSHLVVDEAGTWRNREEFTPFGATSFGSFTKKRYRFSGKETDEESKLCYFGARYYAPWLMRWISVDPLFLSMPNSRREPVFPKSYAYCDNKPLTHIDPVGLQEQGTQTTPAPQVNLTQAPGNNEVLVPSFEITYRSNPGSSSGSQPSVGISISFYTIGDNRALHHQGNPAPETPGTMNDAYRILAERLASSPTHAHGVQTIQDATSILNNLHENGIRVNRIYFVGHGTDDAFFFSGRVPTAEEKIEDPTVGFLADNETQLIFSPRPTAGKSDPYNQFAESISRVAVENQLTRIAFLSCYTGKGQLIPNLGQALQRLGTRSEISGYRRYFRIDVNGRRFNNRIDDGFEGAQLPPPDYTGDPIEGLF